MKFNPKVMPRAKTFYLTKKGLQDLEKEYQKLKALRGARSKDGAPSIWDSEELNAEFIAFRDDMDLLDARLEELEYILKNHQLIKAPVKEARGEVQLGATVTLEVACQTDQFMVVGTLEANPSLGRISDECPVGRALMGHKVGEQVVVCSPKETVYTIKKISYK